MLRGVALALIFFATAAPSPRDVLSRAKQLYNGAQYDAAIDAASTAAKTPDLAAAAQLVMARAYLERFRATGNGGDKDSARDALKQVRSMDLGADDRMELSIALGESLYFDGQAGAAAEQFELALAHADRKQPARRERLLDWWATALDRQAQSSPDAVARPLQARIVRRMEEELHGDVAATVASYWLAAAARSSGDIERAWDAAIAGWVRVSQLGSRGDGARRELDALVTQAIIPDRARLVSPPSPEAAAASMRSQWEALKKAWS
jgi:tetratricopeptide (TPR) repeat protein